MMNGLMYSVAFNREVKLEWLFPSLFGILFVVMGNYIPKVVRNRTFGIKISWTMNNEENWNKTHRLAGKLWVAGGIVMIAGAFLPMKWAIGVFLVLLLTMIVVPFAYSFGIYRKHKKQGISYQYAPASKAEKVALKISAIAIPLILIGVLVLMFTGSIEYEFTENTLKINATYHNDIAVNYAEIDSIEFREDLDFGMRNWGFNSAKLSLGNFQNEEFGNYTLYAYTASDSAVVIKSGEHILVITGKNTAETKTLYDSLKARID